MWQFSSPPYDLFNPFLSHAISTAIREKRSKSEATASREEQIFQVTYYANKVNYILDQDFPGCSHATQVSIGGRHRSCQLASRKTFETSHVKKVAWKDPADNEAADAGGGRELSECAGDVCTFWFEAAKTSDWLKRLSEDEAASHEAQFQLYKAAYNHEVLRDRLSSLRFRHNFTFNHDVEEAEDRRDGAASSIAGQDSRPLVPLAGEGQAANMRAAPIPKRRKTGARLPPLDAFFSSRKRGYGLLRLEARIAKDDVERGISHKNNSCAKEAQKSSADILDEIKTITEGAPPSERAVSAKRENPFSSAAAVDIHLVFLKEKEQFPAFRSGPWGVVIKWRNFFPLLQSLVYRHSMPLPQDRIAQISASKFQELVDAHTKLSAVDTSDPLRSSSNSHSSPSTNESIPSNSPHIAHTSKTSPSSATCAICLDDMGVDSVGERAVVKDSIEKALSSSSLSSLIELPCHHSFHADCMRSVFRIEGQTTYEVACPSCRFTVLNLDRGILHPCMLICRAFDDNDLQAMFPKLKSEIADELKALEPETALLIQVAIVPLKKEEPPLASAIVLVTDRKGLELVVSMLKGFKRGFFPPSLLISDNDGDSEVRHDDDDGSDSNRRKDVGVTYISTVIGAKKIASLLGEYKHSGFLLNTRERAMVDFLYKFRDKLSQGFTAI